MLLWVLSHFTLFSHLSYELTKIYAEEEELNMNPLNGALLALMAFIMTVPQIIFDGGMMKL